MDFYPSITENLLINALDFAKAKSDLCEDEIAIIRHARNSLLFKDDEVWTKRTASNDSNNFDVTMGSFDGAEICELVGLYMLNLLVKRFGKNYIGIYRDDGLAVVPYANGPKIERARKDIITIFSNNGLKITAECNLSVTDFLDVTFDLNNGTYCPYKKPGKTLLYINKNSNHPPSIIKNLANNIVKRVSDLSSNSEQFDKAKNPYQKALRESGYKASF